MQAIPATAHMLPVSYLELGDTFVCDHATSVSRAPELVTYRVTGEPFPQLGTTLLRVEMTSATGAVTHGHITVDEHSVLVTSRAS